MIYTSAVHAQADRAAIASLGMRGGFKLFVRKAWHQVDKSPFVDNWHLDAMAEHLEAVARRDIRSLVINIPPSCTKSMMASVLWQSWLWTQDPGRWFMAISYGESVALRDSRKHRMLVQSAWYRARWPEIKVVDPRDGGTGVSEWNTTLGGKRYTATIHGQVMGMHGDDMTIDDPIDPEGVTSSAELDAVEDFYQGTAPTRFRNPPTSTLVCTMQRLHMRDLAALMIREGATVLCLPMRYESGHPWRWKGDPRSADGELLNPTRYPQAEVDKVSARLGSLRDAAQLQQRPAPAGGHIFKETSFKFWTTLPTGGRYSLSVDFAFKKSSTSSFVVIQVWYVLKANMYLVDQVRRRMDFNESVAALVAVSAQYPLAFLKLIEDKANGTGIMNHLDGSLSGMRPVLPKGSKEERAQASQPVVESGNVYLPDPKSAKYPDGRVGAPWVNTSAPGDPCVGGFIGEVTTFPNAATDDQVDAMTQAILELAPMVTDKLQRAMDNANKE